MSEVNIFVQVAIVFGMMIFAYSTDNGYFILLGILFIFYKFIGALIFKLLKPKE